MAYTTSPIPLSYEEHYRLCSVLSSSTTKIITASTARLYESRFDAPRNAWAYTGLKGIVAFGYDSSSRSSRRHAANYWFKLVDIRRGKVIWQHEIRQAIEYEAEMPFFHAFSGELCKFGFRFDEDENAAIVFQEVTQRVAEISVSKPASHSSTVSSSSKLSSKSSKPAFEPTPKASSSQRRGVERPKISAPVSESFEHVAHMGVDDSANFNVTPEWTKLLNRLEGLGVDADMVEENFEFVKGFLAGAEAIRSTPTSPPKSHTHPSPSSSRTPSVDSLDYYEHNPGPYARDRKPRNVLRKPAPSNFYQY